MMDMRRDMTMRRVSVMKRDVAIDRALDYFNLTPSDLFEDFGPAGQETVEDLMEAVARFAREDERKRLVMKNE